MKAVLGDTVIAEAPREDLISIEGNWYFPPASVHQELLAKKGLYYNLFLLQYKEDFSGVEGAV